MGGLWLLQAIFFWTLLARHISQAFDQHPELRPQQQDGKTEVITGGHSPGTFRAAKLSAEQERKAVPAFSSRAQSNLNFLVGQERQLAEIFELFDTDGGGTMDREEFRTAMLALGFQGGSDRLELDQVDDDGVLTLEEFMALMKGELTGQVVVPFKDHCNGGQRREGCGDVWRNAASSRMFCVH